MNNLFKLPSVSFRAFRVWQRNLDSYKRFYKANLLGSLGEPLLYLFGMGFGLGSYIASINEMSYVQYIAPGLIMATSMYTATFECTFGAYTRMVEQKTYDAILATPLTIGDIVLGEILWGATKSLISGGIMLIIITAAGLLKGIFLSIVPVVVLIFIVGILFSSIAMTVTALSPSYDFFSYYFTLALAPMFFFSGIFFPVDKFPDIVVLLSYMLPLTHAVNISRSLITGNLTYTIFCIGVPFLLTLTGLFIIASVNLIERRIIK